MKRVLTFLAIMLLPLSVMAMTPVSDSTLSDVTGQAGVNINVDITANVAIGTMAWGDSTGLDTWNGASAWGSPADTAGWVGVTGFNISNMIIKARTADTFNGYSSGSSMFGMKPITIDVATGGAHAGVTFVRIGLGSIDFQMGALDFNVALGGSASPNTPNLTETLGHVYVGALHAYLNPASFIDIFKDPSQGTCGVTFDMFVMVDELTLSTVSWGDLNGGVATPWIGGGSAGYIGLNALSVGKILIDGSVSVDIATVTAGIYVGHGACTVVHLEFNGGTAVASTGAGTPLETVGLSNAFRFAVLGPITGKVMLGNQKDFLGTVNGELGDIYISKFMVDMADGSWVDIWAH